MVTDNNDLWPCPDCGNVDLYLTVTDDGPVTICCEAPVSEGPDGEPDRTDPDPAFHNSNFYDITSR